VHEKKVHLIGVNDTTEVPEYHKNITFFFILLFSAAAVQHLRNQTQKKVVDSWSLKHLNTPHVVNPLGLNLSPPNHRIEFNRLSLSLNVAFN